MKRTWARDEDGVGRNFRRPRSGATVITWIVVGSLVLLVGTLLATGILNAREAARRTQCKNNLKQLGLALYNYHNVFDVVPPGYVINPNGSYMGWSWSVLLIPFAESSPLYNDMVERFPGGLQGNPADKLYAISIPWILCPSEQGSPAVQHVAVVTTPVVDGVVSRANRDVLNGFGRSTYFGVAGYLQEGVGGIAANGSGEPSSSEGVWNQASLGNAGTSFDPAQRYCDPRNFRGVFGQNSSTAVNDLKDGAANTLLVGERYVPADDGPEAVGHGNWVGVPDCSTAAGLAMSLGDTATRLNAGVATRAQSTGFGSHHTGGAFFCMADGSARWINDAIDLQVYRDLSTIDDGREVAAE